MNAPLRSSIKHGCAVSNSRKGAAAGGTRRLLPALLALGGTCGLAAAPASALELGPINVQSTLGTPLRASISYALNPQEAIHDYCIYLRPGRTASGLPSIDRASVALSNGTILLTGREALSEPLLSLQLAVDCPGAAQLTREYAIFLSPWMPSAQVEPTAAVPATSVQTAPVTSTRNVPATTVATTTSVAVAPTASSTAPATLPSRIADARPAADTSSIEAAPLARSTTYRVQQGDTLSGIAQRIADRSVSIWQAVDVIFATNPGAFIDNDRDFLQAGALLRIPASLKAASNDQSDPAPTGARTPSVAPALEQYSSGNADSSGDAADSTRATDVSAEARVSSAETPVAADATERNSGEAEVSLSNAALPVRTADSALESASPFVAPATSADVSETGASSFEPAVEVIPETAIELPATAQSTTIDRNDSAANDSGSWSWLIWLGGSGVALLLALLLFGRTLRSRFGGNADLIADEPAPNRRKSDAGRNDEEAVNAAADPVVDFGFGEAAPENRALPLDGDLEAGFGFLDNGEIDVAQDFGFSATDDLRLGLDLEFSEESAVRLQDDETAMLVTGQPPEEPVIVNEIPPEDEAPGVNDLSLVLDSMRHPVGDSNETTKDLQALELDADDVGQADDDAYTLNEEVDYKILEQDYEDELTATQALSAELAEAARGLRADMDNHHERNESRNADDSVNEEMTAEMPSAENDATAAMEIESATHDTKKLNAQKTGT